MANLDDTPISQFEKSLKALEALVESMEKGDLSLEKSLEKFEKGIALTRTCQTALNYAEQKIKVLVEESETLEPIDFEDEDED